MRLLRSVLGVLSACATTTFALRVLVVSPMFARSHVQFLGALADDLVRAGHQVDTVLIEVDTFNTAGITKSNIIRIPRLQDSYLHAIIKNDPFDDLMEMFDYGVLDAVSIMMLHYAQDTVLQYEQYLKPLETEEGYDIGISEELGALPHYLYSRLGVRHSVLAAATPMASLVAHALSIHMPASYLPNPIGTAFVYEAPNFSFYSRLKNYIYDIASAPMFRHMCERQRAYLSSLGEEMDDTLETMRRAELFVDNAHPLVDHFRPLSRQFAYAGTIGFAEKEREAETQGLPQEVIRALETGKDGIVIVSFGSLAMTEYLSDKHLVLLMNAFAKFPTFNIIIKLSATVHRQSVISNFTNVFPVEWLPQAALLRLQETRAFISHCGANSILEAAYYGVPVIAVPLFGDQHYNAAALQSKGVAVIVEKSSLSADSLGAAIQQILHDSKIRNASLRLRQALRAYPKSNFAEMIEFVAAHPSHLQPLHERRSFLIEQQFDIFIFIFLLITVLLFILYRLFVHLFVKASKAKTE